MTAKEIFESLDLSQLPKDAADKFRKVEKATKGFTIESEKVNTFMRGAYKKIKETKPTALKNLKVEEKIIKKEVKKGENTQVVEDLEYKVKGTKKVAKKTPTPSKPKRSGETAMERARKIRKKGEAWKDALARAQKELKAEATKAKKDAEKVVSTTSQALKSLEKMIQNDPKLKGYPRTYGKQSKRIDANKDAKIKAKPAGKRVSKKGHKNQYGESKGGRVYWENRDNRSDRYAPNFPNKVFLEMGGETDDLGFPTGHTFLVVEVSPDGTKNLIKSTTDYMTALMSSAVTRGRKTNKDNRVVIVDKEDKKVIHEAFEAGGEITITPTQIVNNPDYLVGTTTMTELFECGGVTAYQEGGEVFVTPSSLLNAGSGDYVAGSNTMSNMFAKGGELDWLDNQEEVEVKIGSKTILFDVVEFNDVYVFDPATKQDEDKADGLMERNENAVVDGLSRFLRKNVKGVAFSHDENHGGSGFAFKADEKFAKGGIVNLYYGGEQEDETLPASSEKDAANIAMRNGAEHYEFVSRMAKGGETLPSAQSIIDKFRSQGVTDETIVEIAVNQFNNYLKESGRLKNPKGANDLANLHYEIIQLLRPNLKMEKGGRLGFDGLAKKVAKRYEGKPVKSKYQKEYGKTYSKEEAMEVGRKVAAKVYGQQQANMKKMAKGGEVDGRLNLKVKDYLDAYLKGEKVNSPEYQEALMLILKGALRDANYHSEARQVHNYFPKAGNVYIDTQMEDVIEDKGVDIAKMAKWDGNKIIDAFAYYTNLRIGGGFGNRLMSLKESSMAKGGEIENKYGNRAELLEVRKMYSSDRLEVISEDFNLLGEINKKEFGGQGLIEKYGTSSNYVLYEPIFFAKGGMTKGQTIAENFNLQDKVQNVEFWNNDVVVTGKDGKIARIDLDEGTRTQLNAKGGSLDGHGLKSGDVIISQEEYLTKILDKDGNPLFVNLQDGYRGREKPLPFAKGGAVGGMKIPDIAKKFGKTTADVFAQLQVGEKHEMEHTNDPKKARKIALDHLSSDLDYYTKLNRLGL